MLTLHRVWVLDEMLIRRGEMVSEDGLTNYNGGVQTLYFVTRVGGIGRGWSRQEGGTHPVGIPINGDGGKYWWKIA